VVLKKLLNLFLLKRQNLTSGEEVSGKINWRIEEYVVVNAASDRKRISKILKELPPH